MFSEPSLLDGRSLQEYLRAKFVELAGQPDAEVLIARVRVRKAADVASLAHTDLMDLRVEFFPCQPCGARVWELPENVTCYDGWSGSAGCETMGNSSMLPRGWISR